MPSKAPPGTPVDFRGTPLRVGDLICASSGGEQHSLVERVVVRLTPKTALSVRLDVLRDFEKKNHVNITTVQELLAPNWAAESWRALQRRGYDMVARLGDFV